MQLKMFSIYDLVTNVYQPPMFAHNAGDCMRIVQNHMRQDNNLSRYPDNFVLFDVGTFDDSTGVITSEKPVQVVPISEIVQKTE